MIQHTKMEETPKWILTLDHSNMVYSLIQHDIAWCNMIPWCTNTYRYWWDFPLLSPKKRSRCTPRTSPFPRITKALEIFDLTLVDCWANLYRSNEDVKSWHHDNYQDWSPRCPLDVFCWFCWSILDIWRWGQLVKAPFSWVSVDLWCGNVLMFWCQRREGGRKQIAFVLLCCAQTCSDSDVESGRVIGTYRDPMAPWDPKGPLCIWYTI